MIGRRISVHFHYLDRNYSAKFHNGLARSFACRRPITGYVVAREERGLLVSVEKDGRRVWLDVGNTVRLNGDRLGDPDDVLFYQVVDFLKWGNGPTKD